jgi:DNA-binding transcriptional LysR family regulator
MVQQNLGVALLPRMALAAELKSRSLRAVRLVGTESLRRPIVALRRRDAGTPIGPVAGFLDTLHEVLG